MAVKPLSNSPVVTALCTTTAVASKTLKRQKGGGLHDTIGRVISKDRLYTVDEFRMMLAGMFRGDFKSAAAACADVYPSAQRSLERYAKRIRKDASLVRATPQKTLAAQLDYICNYLDLDQQGHDNLTARRMFSEDELTYFARSLKQYADLGWPMAVPEIQQMMQQAVRAAVASPSVRSLAS